MRRLFRFVDYLAERAVAAIVAVAFSQFFAFIQQYRQRLGGHLDEARRSFETVANDERTAGTDAQKVLMDTLGARVDDLQQAYDAIFAAPVLLKPVVFLLHLDPIVAEGTLADFAPQIPLDLASLIYAAIGLILAAVIYRTTSNGIFGARRDGRQPRGRRVRPDSPRGRRRSR